MSTLKSDSIQPTATGNSLVLKTGVGDVERMRIDTTGLVGIGTQVPLAPLHVSALAAEVRITAPTISGADWGILPQTNNTTPVFRIYDRCNFVDRLTISSAGLVTIPGTLTVTGTASSAAAPTTANHLCNKTYVDNASHMVIVGQCPTLTVGNAGTNVGGNAPGFFTFLWDSYGTSTIATFKIKAIEGTWFMWINSWLYNQTMYDRAYYNANCPAITTTYNTAYTTVAGVRPFDDPVDSQKPFFIAVRTS